MKNLKKTALALAAAAVAYLSIGALVHFLVIPLEAPDPSTFPRAGDRLASAYEGFDQLITRVDAGYAYTRLVIEPGASGPPVHWHRDFAESFRVAEGTLMLWVDGETIELGAGESYTIPAGVRHKPFNPGDARVVIEDPSKPTLPLSFAACLAQVYGWMDESPKNMRGPRPLLQMTLFKKVCDTHILPAPVEPIAEALLAPTARLIGLRGYYPGFALHPATGEIG